MVYPFAGQPQKAGDQIDEGKQNPEKLPGVQHWGAQPALPPIQPTTQPPQYGGGQNNGSGLVAVKTPKGRKKKSGFCVGVSFALGIVAGIALVGFTVLAVKFLVHHNKGILYEFF